MLAKCDETQWKYYRKEIVDFAYDAKLQNSVKQSIIYDALYIIIILLPYIVLYLKASWQT